MATIANLNVKLTAGIGGFAAGMSKGKKILGDFSGGVSAATSKVLGWGSALAGVATGGGIALLVKNQMEAIDATAKLSDRLGASTEGLVAIQHAADLSGVGEQVAGAMAKMQKAIGGVAEDGTSTADVFAQLGLDAGALANMGADDAFIRIAESISKIENPVARTNAEIKIFGKSGQALDSLLTQGAAGIAAAADETNKLGTSFSRIDAAKVEAANDAMTRAGKVFTGIGTQLAIEVAPFVEATATKFVEMATSGDGMGKRVAGAFEFILTGAAKLMDWVELLKGGWHSLAGVAAIAIGGVMIPLTLLIKGVEWLAEELTGVKSTFGDTFEAMQEGIMQEGRDQFAKAGESFEKFASGAHSKAAAQVFDDIRAKASANAAAVADSAAKMNAGAFAAENMAAKLKEAADNAKKVTDTLADLRKQVDQAGMTDSQKKFADLKSLGADPAQLADAEKLLATIEKQDATAKLHEKAMQVVESIRSPLDQYNNSLNELGEMLDAGLLTQGEFEKAAGLAQSKLTSATTPTAGTDFVEAGSAAAQRFMFEQSRGFDSMKKDDIPKKQLGEAEQTNSLLTEVIRAISDTRGDGDTVLDEF